MAPVATNETQAPVANNGPVKAVKKAAEPLFNPFYSPTVASDKDDSDYKYAKYKVRTTAAAVLLLRLPASCPSWRCPRCADADVFVALSCHCSRTGLTSSGSPSRSSL